MLLKKIYIYIYIYIKYISIISWYMLVVIIFSLILYSGWDLDIIFNSNKLIRHPTYNVALWPCTGTLTLQYKIMNKSVKRNIKSCIHTKTTRILRVLHIAIHCSLPATKIRGPKILEVSPCSDYILKYKFKGHNSAKNHSTGTKFELKL